MGSNQDTKQGDYTYMILFGQNMASYHSEIPFPGPGWLLCFFAGKQ